ncbi:MAG: AAA family ATPase [Tannerella sp.]|jgi:predicted AAA+ superfamily ATPase|nr:AAA family ATPase [Tannerella sp.]
MESLYTSFYHQLKNADSIFKRYLFDDIDWNHRLICILGARGSGKTTMLLQTIKAKYGKAPRHVLYASMDHIWFSGNTLYSLGEQFVINGGKVLFLDEVHKYKNWSQEIKNLYDSFPSLKIVFTGSSILEIYRGDADLSRRVVQYTLHGLSFREYLELSKVMEIGKISLTDLLDNHVEIAQDITQKTHILSHFNNYLRYGFFPYFKEGISVYPNKLRQTVNVVLETDLPVIENINYYSIEKIKRLLYIISTLVPFTPNVTELSNQIGISRNSLLQYLHYLEKAQIVNTLEDETKILRKLTKPEKIFLGNTNLCYAFALNVPPEKGNLRETFFYNQLSVQESVTSSKQTDFIVNGKYSFEVGGKNKTAKQIAGLPDSYLALDDIETGYANKIPLWMFGIMY